MTIEYKYNEGDLLREITQYIDATYGEHYSQNQYQATEFIIDGGHGIGFTVGNILKYAQRYGRKGTTADWRKDLLKVIHYAIIAMHVHDEYLSEDDEDDLLDILYEPDTVDTTTETSLPDPEFKISMKENKVNIKPFELKTSLSLSDTITVNPNYTFATAKWYEDNMGTSSLLTSDTIPSIIEFTAEPSKKTNKKKD